MGKSNNSKIVFGIVVAIGLIGAGVYFDIIPTSFTSSNVTPLSISDAVPIDCDVSNFLVLRFTDGTEELRYTGRDGFVPNSFLQTNSIIDASQGSSGKEIELIRIQLALECGGAIMQLGSATISGTNQASLCTYVAGAGGFSNKECLIPDVSGTKYIGIQPLIPKPFTYQDGIQPLPILQQSISNRQIKVIQEIILTTDDVFRLYGDPPRDTGLASSMFPQINFVFANGQTLSYDAIAVNDRTVTGWQGWTYVAPPIDSDGDGVFDADDLCPDEVGTEPNGCPVRDSDGDGVNDFVDICPNTPSGETVFLLASNPFRGCSQSQTDIDGDGIFDNIDVCPTVVGTLPNGCPDVTCPDGEIFNPVTNQCEEDEVLCLAVVLPVCGSDGVTYSNSCFAEIEGVTWTDGECQPIGDGFCDFNPNDQLCTDFDGDGIPDGLDDCPANGGDVDQFGCPINPLDFIGIFFPPDTTPPATPPTVTPPTVTPPTEEGFSDFQLIVAGGIIFVIIIAVIAVGTGKAKL